MKPFIIGSAVVFAFVAFSSSTGCYTSGDTHKQRREKMVREQIIARGIGDQRVIAAMMRVPRHRFVPGQLERMAYIDNPLPIGCEQTISQPFIVALMTASLQLQGGERVLEVGTGSGYQAAVLAEMVDTVYTIEIIPELAERARATLDTLGYKNVQVRTGDGYDGWPARAPFDGVIVTAAAPKLPPLLVEQLKVGGRIVIPVGDYYQDLHVYEKTSEGLKLVSSLPVRFVPMVGKIRDSEKE